MTQHTPLTVGKKGHPRVPTPGAKYQPGKVPFVDFEPCHAMTKATGNQCLRHPVPGAEICVMHGGKAEKVQAHARAVLATRKLEASATEALAHEGVRAVEDPLGELGRLASSSQALTEALGKRVNALNELEHYDLKETPTIKAEVQMYERAMDRTARLLDSLVKHGYSERQIQIQETEALLVAGVIRRVIAGLGLSQEQQSKAQELLAAEFRALPARAAPTTGKK